MPYLTLEAKERIDDGERISTPGELNYAITCLLLKYIGDFPTYREFNDVIGALESCKLEFYRRSIVPYEEKKIKENGDVYE